MLAESDALDVLNWVLGSCPWDGMSGKPAGPPEWPFRGGYLRQPNRLVTLYEQCRAEFSFVGKPEKKKPEPAEPKAEPPPFTPRRR